MNLESAGKSGYRMDMVDHAIHFSRTHKLAHDPKNRYALIGARLFQFFGNFVNLLLFRCFTEKVVVANLHDMCFMFHLNNTLEICYNLKHQHACRMSSRHESRSPGFKLEFSTLVQ